MWKICVEIGDAVTDSMSNQWPHVWGGHAKSPRPDNFEKPFSSSGDETDSLSTSPDSPVQSCGKDSEKNLLRPQSSTIESELVCYNPAEHSGVQWYNLVLVHSTFVFHVLKALN